jgi:hypothetical protein
MLAREFTIGSTEVTRESLGFGAMVDCSGEEGGLFQLRSKGPSEQSPRMEWHAQGIELCRTQLGVWE